jgi:signal transduction histidine kinase
MTRGTVPTFHEDSEHKTKARLQYAQEAGGVGLWEWDVETSRTWWSPVFYDLFGIARGDGRSTYEAFLDRVHEDDRVWLDKELVLHTVARTSFEVEFRIVRPDDNVRWIVARGALLGESNDDAVIMIGVIFDVTARKQIEQQLINLNDTLESRVSAEIGERERLWAALHEAETRITKMQQSETLGHLASGVAHDFNNLLVPIMSALESLKRRPQGDDDVDTLINGAALAAQSARTLVGRMLSFADERKRIPQIVDVGALVSGMRDLLVHMVPHAINLELQIAVQLPHIEVDPGQLELSIMNLAVNARDAMPHGGMLTIAVFASEAGLVVRVTDNGTGMDEETALRATQSFFTTKPSGKGTGLGLFMARRLVDRFKGSLIIDSAVGCGTSVSLRFPVISDRSANEDSLD